MNQVSQATTLSEVAKQIGAELDVRVQNFDLLVKEDPTSPPMFMFSFDAFGNSIFFVKDGEIVSKREIKVDDFNFNPVELKEQIRKVIVEMIEAQNA